jgi:hypothetical protein
MKTLEKPIPLTQSIPNPNKHDGTNQTITVSVTGGHIHLNPPRVHGIASYSPSFDPIGFPASDVIQVHENDTVTWKMGSLAPFSSSNTKIYLGDGASDFFTNLEKGDSVEWGKAYEIKRSVGPKKFCHFYLEYIGVVTHRFHDPKLTINS